MAKWTKARREAQSKRLHKYWERVRAISEVEKIPVTKARDYYSRGLFRGVREDASARVADRYKAKRDTLGRLVVERISPTGKRTRVKAEAVERAFALSTYEAMVRRLVIHTGWSRRDVRGYLSAYPQWRDGVSPLYRMAEAREAEEDDEDYEDD